MGDLLDQRDLTDLSIGSTLADIDPIRKSSAQMIKERKDIVNIVEEPLVTACEQLYDKNIRTLATSANKKDLKIGQVYIILDYETLSPKNKEKCEKEEIVSPVNEYWGRRTVDLVIPVTEDILKTDISEKAMRIAQSFSKQKPTWIPRYSINELKKIYRIPDTDEEFDSPEAWKEEGYFYDPESKKLYLSEEHFLKVKDAENLKE